MRPSDLLACQHDFVARAEGYATFRRVMAEALRSPYIAARHRVPEVFRGDTFVNRLPTWGRGMAIEVTPHMTDLITWVAAEMHDDDPIDLDLAPSPYGFAHFEKPLVVRDIRGDDLFVSWMVWGPVPVDAFGRAVRGYGVLQLCDLHNPDANASAYLQTLRERDADMINEMGRWIYTGFRVLASGDVAGPAYNDPIPAIMDDPEWQGDLVGSTNVVRLAYALWTVMNQPIADLREEQVDRATKRRMTRMKIPPAVTVITLRRPANPHEHEGNSHVEWQHHWIVRGHPRWQAYGPGRKERKLIWVNAHMKGNLDAPLKQSEKVYRVAR